MNKDNISSRRRAALRRMGKATGMSAIAISGIIIAGCNSDKNGESNQQFVANVGPAAYTNVFPESPNEEVVNKDVAINPIEKKQHKTEPKKKESASQVQTSKPQTPKPQTEKPKPKPSNSGSGNTNTYTSF